MMELLKTKVRSIPVKIVKEKIKAPGHLTEMEIYFLEEQEDKLARLQDEVRMKTEEISMINRIKKEDFYTYSFKKNSYI